MQICAADTPSFLPLFISAISSILPFKPPQALWSLRTIIHIAPFRCCIKAWQASVHWLHLDQGVTPHICHKRRWRKFRNIFRKDERNKIHLGNYKLHDPNKPNTAFQIQLHDPKIANTAFQIRLDHPLNQIHHLKHHKHQMFCPNMRFGGGCSVFVHLHKVHTCTLRGALECAHKVHVFPSLGCFRIWSFGC